MLASLLGLAGRDEAGVLPYAGGNAEPISSPEIVDYRNRQFDPSTGRFLQRDPVLGGDELFNPYCFPSNNPVTNADPMGEHVFVYGQRAAQTFVNTLKKKFNYETYAVCLDKEDSLYIILAAGKRPNDAWSREMRQCRNLRQVVGAVGALDRHMIYRRGADGDGYWENWSGNSVDDLIHLYGVLSKGAEVWVNDPSYVHAAYAPMAGIADFWSKAFRSDYEIKWWEPHPDSSSDINERTGCFIGKRGTQAILGTVLVAEVAIGGAVALPVAAQAKLAAVGSAAATGIARFGRQAWDATRSAGAQGVQLGQRAWHATGGRLADWLSRPGTSEVPINQKSYEQYAQQLLKHGPSSVHKALCSAQATLIEHQEKLRQIQAAGGFTSAVEKTIRNVSSQIATLEQFIRDKGL
jgi:RHS repeat-associated protein